MAHVLGPATISPDLAAQLFPPGVVAAELREPGDPALLLPEESQFLGRAVPKRVQEFAAGRLCARRALLEFGIVGFAVKVGPGRQPLWPEGWVGTITHTAGYCAAAVAARSSVRGLGMDSETLGDVHAELWPSICSETETDWLRSLAPALKAAAATMIFSAKEAFYKCQYPVTGEPLGFHDVQVDAPGWDGSPGAPDLRYSEVLIRPTRRIGYARHVDFPMRGHIRWERTLLTAAVSVPA